MRRKEFMEVRVIRAIRELQYEQRAVHQKSQKQYPAQRDTPGQHGGRSGDGKGWGTHERTSAVATAKRRNESSSSFACRTNSIPKVVFGFALWHLDSQFDPLSPSQQSSQAETASRFR